MMDAELIERIKTLVDMDMRSGEGGNISPEYIARSLQISIADAKNALEELKV